MWGAMFWIQLGSPNGPILISYRMHVSIFYGLQIRQFCKVYPVSTFAQNTLIKLIAHCGVQGHFLFSTERVKLLQMLIKSEHIKGHNHGFECCIRIMIQLKQKLASYPVDI